MSSSLKALVEERLERVDLNFNAFGVDPFGVDKRELTRFLTAFGWFYKEYFSVRTVGMEHIPPRGRAMLVGNHAGGIAIDAAMVIASTFFEMEPPRLAQSMAELFLYRWPFAAKFAGRLGQFAGIAEHATRLLQEERLLLVFPEGARGTAKLFSERHSLVRFGTGFVRLALQNRAPIVPFAFVGGGEAFPTMINLVRVGELLGVPYIPITPYLLPVPLPVRCVLLYGKPISLEGDGSEPDELLEDYAEAVKENIAALLKQGRALREHSLHDAERTS